MTQIPEKLECGHDEEFIVSSPQYTINAIIDFITARQELEEKRYKELTSRLSVISKNQLEMKRGETTSGTITVEMVQPVHRGDQPNRHREVDIMFALSSATGFDGKVDQNKFFDLMSPIVAIIEGEAAEAYKAKLLSDNAQV